GVGLAPRGLPEPARRQSFRGGGAARSRRSRKRPWSRYPARVSRWDSTMSASRLQSVLRVRKVSTRRRSAWAVWQSGVRKRSRTGRRLGNFTPVTLITGRPFRERERTAWPVDNGSDTWGSG